MSHRLREGCGGGATLEDFCFAGDLAAGAAAAGAAAAGAVVAGAAAAAGAAARSAALDFCLPGGGALFAESDPWFGRLKTLVQAR